MKVKIKPKNSKNEFFDGILTGTKDVIAGLRGQRKLTCRKVTLPSPPTPMSAGVVINLRKKFNVSQRLFAAMLNVSIKTIQSWEQGLSEPTSSTLRLLEIMQKHPDIVKKDFMGVA